MITDIPLRHICIRKIDPTETFTDIQMQIFRNIRHEILCICNKHNEELKDAMGVYDNIRDKYYSLLLRKDQTLQIFKYNDILIDHYNLIINARNVCAGTRQWRRNFIIIDNYIMSNIASPFRYTQFEEFDKMLYGILQLKYTIEFEDECNDDELEILNLLRQYEHMCENMYKDIHKNDDKYINLHTMATELQQAVQDEEDCKINFLEYSMILKHIDNIISPGEANAELDKLIHSFLLLQELE